MNLLRCAVIGCGRIGCGFDDKNTSKISFTHAGSYFLNPNTKLVALCDIDKDKLQKYGKKYNISKLYEKSSDMYNNEDLDCVSICTLAQNHYSLVKKAVENKIRGIFLEKPISNSLYNASNIIELCKKNNVVLILDHRRRFAPFYYSVKKILKDKNFGHITKVNTFYSSGIANTGTHQFDLLRFFFGDVYSIESSGTNMQNDPNLDVTLEFNNGIKATMTAIESPYYGISEFDIFGTKGRLQLDLNRSIVTYYKSNKKFKLSDKNFWFNIKPSKIKLNYSTKSDIMLGIENLVKTIHGVEKPKCSGEDGYKSLELITAAIISAKNKIKIRLPLTKSRYKITSR